MKHKLDHLYRSYIIGFVLSMVLTLIAFGFTTIYKGDGHQVQDTPYIGAAIVIVALAIMQLVAQVVFFLHLGREAKPRYNTAAFLFMGMVVLIVGIGSLWIMYNLNYHMSPDQVESTIIEDENLQNHADSSHE